MTSQLVSETKVIVLTKLLLKCDTFLKVSWYTTISKCVAFISPTHTHTPPPNPPPPLATSFHNGDWEMQIEWGTFKWSWRRWISCCGGKRDSRASAFNVNIGGAVTVVQMNRPLMQFFGCRRGCGTVGILVASKSEIRYSNPNNRPQHTKTYKYSWDKDS